MSPVRATFHDTHAGILAAYILARIGARISVSWNAGFSDNNETEEKGVTAHSHRPTLTLKPSRLKRCELAIRVMFLVIIIGKG